MENQYGVHRRSGTARLPDFTILCKSNRREIIWEHLGLLDDPDYLEKSIWKIALYERNGYFLGDRLIITYETKKHPLDIKLAEEKMERCCLQLQNLKIWFRTVFFVVYCLSVKTGWSGR